MWTAAHHSLMIEWMNKVPHRPYVVSHGTPYDIPHGIPCGMSHGVASVYHMVFHMEIPYGLRYVMAHVLPYGVPYSLSYGIPWLRLRGLFWAFLGHFWAHVCRMFGTNRIEKETIKERCHCRRSRGAPVHWDAGGLLYPWDI